MEVKSLLVKKVTIRLLGVILITCVADGACPQRVFIQKWSTSTISCVTEGKEIEETFWYKGSISHTSPILLLENGIPGGTEYGRGHFLIDSKGAMTINNASLEHEADYVFVAYYEDDTSEKRNVTVVITVPPDPPCPNVTNCSLCGECQVIADANGTVTCSMTAVRPKMSLSWISKNETGISFTLHPLNIRNNSNGYSWDVSRKLSYTTYTCDQRFVVQCIAQDENKVLNYSTPVQIKTGSCQVTSHINKISVLIPAIGILILTFLAAVTLAIFIKVRRKDQESRQSKVDPEQQPLNSTESVCLDTTAQRVADYLKRAYETHCSVSVLPYFEPIPITLANVDLEITFNDVHGSPTKAFCHEILRKINLKDLHRAMIIADRGNGKTYFMKQIIYQWSQEKVNSFILIYIDGKDVAENMDVGSVLSNLLPKPHDFNKETIHQVLKSSEYLVLIDGLDDFSLEDGGKGLDAESKRQSTSYTQSNESCELYGRITINEILEDNMKEEERSMHVWITSSRPERTRYNFQKPYVKIKLPIFSEQQMNSYIEKTFSYYSNILTLTKRQEEGIKISARQSVSKYSDPSELVQFKENATKTLEEEEKSNSEEPLQIVRFFVKKHNILKDFEQNIFLFAILVHIITTKLTLSPDSLGSVNLKNVASVIEETVASLILFFEKKNTRLSEEYIGKIKISLEEFAFQMAFPDETMNESFPKEKDDIIQIAETIGILVKTEHDDLDEIFFCNTRIEEFFTAKYITKLDKVKRESLRKTIEKCDAGVWELISCLEDLK